MRNLNETNFDIFTNALQFDEKSFSDACGMHQLEETGSSLDITTGKSSSDMESK